MSKISSMGEYFGKKLSESLDTLDMTKYRLHKLADVPESSVIRIANGHKRPTNEIIEKFAKVKELQGIGLTEIEMLDWRAVDDYPHLANFIIKRKELFSDVALVNEFYRRHKDKSPEQLNQILLTYLRGEIESLP